MGVVFTRIQITEIGANITHYTTRGVELPLWDEENVHNFSDYDLVFWRKIYMGVATNRRFNERENTTYHIIEEELSQRVRGIADDEPVIREAHVVEDEGPTPEQIADDPAAREVERNLRNYYTFTFTNRTTAMPEPVTEQRRAEERQRLMQDLYAEVLGRPPTPDRR